MRFWKRKKRQPKIYTAAKYVDDISKAMWNEHYQSRCIMMLLAKLKTHAIELEDPEKVLLRKAMLGV